MRILSGLLLIIMVIVGVALLVPVLTVGVALLGAAAVFVIWLLPMLIIAASDRTTTGEKICWILAILCLSWFAWVFYFFLAPIKPRRDYYYY
ncbi:MAG: hypothetical protein RLZZ385_1216 [Pseudomonadota bacterium]